MSKAISSIDYFFLNLYHPQKLKKQVDIKDIKPKNYAFSDKSLLKSKHIKTKYN